MGEIGLSERERALADEQRLVKAFGLGLPLVTISAAAVVGMLIGPATAILVIAAGLLLGVIALLWGSIRTLSGEAPLPPELEALDMGAQGATALSTRKKMLLRALKDLENEHAIGKIEDEDYEQISSTYRTELKVVLKRIDESLAPHRPLAEKTARAYLEKIGLSEVVDRGDLPDDREYVKAGAAEAARSTKASQPERKPRDADEPSARVSCPKCGESNEPDAKFCKECATKLSSARPELVSASSETDSEDPEDA